jgi:hypothetical protein
VLVAVYLLAAALEIAGLADVVRRISRDRKRTQELLERIRDLPSPASSITGRDVDVRRLESFVNGQAKGLRAVAASLAESGASGWRTYLGPAAILLGIILGAAGNLAAL